MSKKKAVPIFESEDEEREFWEEHDSTDYLEWNEARRVVLPNLKPSTKTISLRLPEHMLEELKLLANQRDVPYQSLLKVFLAERLEAELGSVRSPATPRRSRSESTRRQGATHFPGSPSL